MTKEIKDLLKCKHYSEAIKLYNSNENIDIDGFVSYILDIDKCSKSLSFWETLTAEIPFLSELLASERGDELLYNYFSLSKIPLKLTQLIAELNPTIFIIGVRTSRAFMREDFPSIKLPKEIAIHLKVWSYFNKEDKRLWKLVEKEYNKIQAIDLEEIIASAIVWFENEIYNRTNDQELHNISQVYNLFISRILSYIDTSKFNYNTFHHKFYELIIHETQITNHLINKIKVWIEYRDSYLFPYCFDLTITPIKENNKIILFRENSDIYKWQLNGCRYDLNRLNYLSSDNITNFIYPTNPFNVDKEQEMMYERMNIDINNTQSFINDLQLNKLIFSENHQIDSMSVLRPLITYRINRFYRYSYSIEKQRSKNKRWIDIYREPTCRSILENIERTPFLLHKKQDFINIFLNASESYTKDSIELLYKLMVYTFNNKYEFNRFNNNGYDVWTTPFLNLGNYVYTYTNLFAFNEWLYGSMNSILKIYKQPTYKKLNTESSFKIEQFLENEFKKRNWNVRKTSAEEASSIEGDVDIIIEEGNISLLIQLKRTYLRTDLQQAHNELINIDRKAARQLNNAEKSLSKPETFYKCKSEVYKWIVTTSFENVLAVINDCLKVNYFDLIEALRDKEIITLSQLIEAIRLDYIIRKYQTLYDNSSIEIKRAMESFGFPIKMNCSKFYNPIIQLKSK